MDMPASDCRFRINPLYFAVLIAMALLFLPTAQSVQAEEAPAAPTGLVLTPGDAKLTASWDLPPVVEETEIEGYTIQYKTADAPDQRASLSGDPSGGWMEISGDKDTTAEITGLTNGVDYDVRVRARYNELYSHWATATGTPAPPVSTPGAPAGLVLALGNAKLAAGWNPPEDDGGAEITGYAVQYKTSAAPDKAGVFGDPASGWVDAGHSGTGIDAEITGLTNGAGYDARVRASSGAGDGPWSAAASATPHEDVIWSAILTVDVDNDYGDGTGTFGCVIDVIISSIDECPEVLTEDDFSFGLESHVWAQFSRYVPSGETARYTTVGISALVPDDSNLRQGKIQVGSEVVSLDDTGRVQWFVPDPGTYRNTQWIYSGFLLYDDSSKGDTHWTEGQRVPLSLQATLPQIQEYETPPGSNSRVSDATLSALTVSDGTNGVPLTPAFASDTASYTASVDNSVSSVTVTPTVNDENATVTVEGAPVTSGAASSPIALTAGEPKAINVVVTAQDETTETYTVSVTRAAAQELQRGNDGGPIGRCRSYTGNTEGLRVCVLPYEGYDAVLMLTLPRPAPANGTIVTLATDPSQTASSDDFTMPSTVTIAEGETSILITIAITDDGEEEEQESIYIYACITPGCDPLNPVEGETIYDHGIFIPASRGAGGL